MPVLDSVGFEQLKPILDAIQRKEPDLNAKLTPPSEYKIERNNLSSDAAELLRLGRRKEARVQDYINKMVRPDVPERIAEAMREQYRNLKALDSVLMRFSRICSVLSVSKSNRDGKLLLWPSCAISSNAAIFSRTYLKATPYDPSDQTPAWRSGANRSRRRDFATASAPHDGLSLMGRGPCVKRCLLACVTYQL